MNILKKATNGKKKRKLKFLGTHIPKNLSSYLTLYANLKGLPKSNILYNLIEGWIKKTKKEIPENELIIQLAKKSYRIWKNPEGRRINFNTFKSLLKRELVYKGVDEKVAINIIEIIEDEKKNDPEEGG